MFHFQENDSDVYGTYVYEYIHFHTLNNTVTKKHNQTTCLFYYGFATLL